MSIHTFLFEDGTWQCEGTYKDESDTEFELTGQITISHEEDLWILEGSTCIHDDKNSTSSTKYEIIPFEKGALSTTWISRNPMHGELNGTFSLIKDAILMHYRSVDGRYSGAELLTLKDRNTYEADGTMYDGVTKISSWKMTMRRITVLFP